MITSLRLHGEEIITGPGSIDALADLPESRCFIVTGKSSMFRNGTIYKIKNMLEKAGKEIHVFSGIGPNPTTKEVENGVEEMNQFQPNAVICVGGGSAIDAGKVMSMFYEYPDMDFEKAKTDFLPLKRQKTKLIAIPSTSGTATEVTKTAVITYEDLSLKLGLKSYGMIPDLAILDGELTLSMPAKIAAQTGMDAMTHAVECYMNHKLEDFSEGLCVHAIEGLLNYLPKSCENGEDLESRQKVHNFQSIAGCAFHNIGLGMDHGISHAFGGFFGYGHGLLNGTALPYVIMYNRQNEIVDKKLSKLERKLQISDLAEEIVKLNERVKIPVSFKEMGIKEEEYRENFEFLLENSMLGSTRSNPIPMTKEEMKKVLDSIYYGEIKF